MSGCRHGKTFKEPCTECQLVLAREGLAWALQSVEKYSRLIEALAPNEVRPWVEHGTGWAKIHNLTPISVLNEPQTPSEREIALAIFTRRSGLHPKRAAEIFEEPPPRDVDVIEALLDAEAVLALSRPNHLSGGAE